MLCSFVNNTSFTIELLFCTKKYFCEAAKTISLEISGNDVIHIEPQQKMSLEFMRRLDRETKPFGWVLNRHCSGFLAMDIKVTDVAEDVLVVISEELLPLWDRFYLLKGHFSSFKISGENCIVTQIAYYLLDKRDIKKLLYMHFWPLLNMFVTVLAMFAVSVYLLIHGEKGYVHEEIGAFFLVGMAAVITKTELVDWFVFIKKLCGNQRFTL